jgi:hypothetical protein
MSCHELGFMARRLVAEECGPFLTASMTDLFNLRDLSKVFQGMSVVMSDVVTDPQKMARLWVHEVR